MVLIVFTSIPLLFNGISFSLSFGTSTRFIPILLAPYIFSNIPPTGLTFPTREISPVIAKSCLIGFFNNALIIHIVIAVPAEGPSIFPPPITLT